MPPSSHVTVIADCHRFLYETCKSEPMKYEAESVIIFRQVGKEPIPVDCVSTTLRDAEPFHSPIEDILTGSVTPCKETLAPNIPEKRYYLPAATPAPSNRNQNGKKHPWALG